jgi:hypothetical protein
MATVRAARASALLPVFKAGGGALCVAHGTYEHATNLAASTVIEYCRIPKGAVVVGGWWGGDDLDTGTEELDMDIGWPADPDGFGNLGVLTGDVSVHLGAAGIWVPFQGVLLADGPVTFTKETVLQATVIADAATGGTGTTSMVAYYYVP